MHSYFGFHVKPVCRRHESDRCNPKTPNIKVAIANHDQLGLVAITNHDRLRPAQIRNCKTSVNLFGIE